MRAGRPHPRRRDGPAARVGAARGCRRLGDRRGRRGVHPSCAAAPSRPSRAIAGSRPPSASRSTRRSCTGSPRPSAGCSEGDIVGLDLGCIVEGYYADCAFTLRSGDVPRAVQELLDVTRESLERGHRAVPARAGGCPTSRTPSRRTCESRTASASCARSWATASAARCTRSRRCRTSATRHGAAAQAGHGAGHRADGDDGQLGGPDPRRRLDGGDEGRQPGRALRAHHRGDGGWSRGPDQQERARRSGGLETPWPRKTRSRSRAPWWSRCPNAMFQSRAGERPPGPGSRERQDADELHPDPAGRPGEGRAVALRSDAGPDHLPVQVGGTSDEGEAVASRRGASTARSCARQGVVRIICKNPRHKQRQG